MAKQRSFAGRLIIDSVSKQYKGGVWALRDFNLDLSHGILGLLGPNGAGKSTLMRILATVTKPSQGKVMWNDYDVVQEPDTLRSVLGYLPQEFGVYPNLNAVEFLSYLAAIKGLNNKIARQRVEELLQVVGLLEIRHRPLGSYSGGMKQRIGIAQALLNDPKLLIVDEPTSGLDPEERLNFRALLSDLSGDRVVILSTHIVTDVEAIATDIAIISGGYLLIHATPDELLQTVEGKVWEWVVPATELPDARLHYLISNTIRRRDDVHLRIVASTPPSLDARAVEPALEDAYLHTIYQNRNRDSA